MCENGQDWDIWAGYPTTGPLSASCTYSWVEVTTSCEYRRQETLARTHPGRRDDNLQNYWRFRRFATAHPLTSTHPAPFLRHSSALTRIYPTLSASTAPRRPLLRCVLCTGRLSSSLTVRVVISPCNRPLSPAATAPLCLVQHAGSGPAAAPSYSPRSSSRSWKKKTPISWSGCRMGSRSASRTSSALAARCWRNTLIVSAALNVLLQQAHAAYAEC